MILTFLEELHQDDVLEVLMVLVGRAGESVNFLAAPALDFFFKRHRLLIFLPSGSGSKGPKTPAPAPWQNSLFPTN